MKCCKCGGTFFLKDEYDDYRCAYCAHCCPCCTKKQYDLPPEVKEATGALLRTDGTQTLEVLLSMGTATIRYFGADYDPRPTGRPRGRPRKSQLL